MNDIAERAVLMTVRARFDPAFPNSVFVLLRRHAITNPGDNEDRVEVASVPEALQILEDWLWNVRV